MHQLDFAKPQHYQTPVRNILPVDGEAYLNNTFFPYEKANTYFNNLKHEIDWQKKNIMMFGKSIPQPRLIAWYGDENVRLKYSSISMITKPWTKTLTEIHESIKKHLGYSFNGVFLNYYRNGKDYMGWHRDNERVMGLQPLIISVSLGAERVFKFRHIKQKHLIEKFELNNGSLLIMKGDTQNNWHHCLPKALRINESRINLTFRNILY